MKKLVIAAMALALSAGVNAQDESAAGSGASAGTIGGIATGTIVAGAVAAGVLAAVVSNNRGTTVNPGPGPDDTCNANDGAPVNGVCTGTTYPAING
jgi:hypothetical protein